MPFISSTIQDIACPTDDVGFWIPFDEEYFILKNASICEVPYCPEDCSCTLGHHSVATRCQSSTAQEFVVNITYPRDAVILYLANISLNSVEPNAFANVTSTLKELYLGNNSLFELRQGVFEGLPNLEHLYLYVSKLKVLHPGAFDGLLSLISLNLVGNVLEVLQPGTFRGLPRLEELYLEENLLTEIYPGACHGLMSLLVLDLDFNRFVELKPGMLDGLTAIEEIDFDNNLIEKVHLNVFSNMSALIELDLDANRIQEIQPGVFNGLNNLVELELDDNVLQALPTGLFTGVPSITRLTVSYNNISTIDSQVLTRLNNLVELHLSHNEFSEFDKSLFQNAPKLKILYIDHNNLDEIHPDLFLNLNRLEVLSLAVNDLSVLPTELFQDLHALRILNISGNNLNRISPQVFQYFDSMLTLDLTKNPLKWITSDLFEIFSKQTTIFVDEYATCCFTESARCVYQSDRSPFISCKRLLPYSVLRVVVWIVGIATIAGNLYVLYSRCGQFTSTRGYVQFFLITNLSMSDLLMGIYMIILISADLRFTEYFPSHSESWRQSILCKLAGALSLLSSEASVFFITLISIDRFMGVKFPFSNMRLRKTSAKFVVTMMWCVSLMISITSVLIPIFQPSLYDVSEVCVGLPISRKNIFVTNTIPVVLNASLFEDDLVLGSAKESVFLGTESSMYFSIAIFTGLNLLCFLVVASCYLVIFITAKQISHDAGRSTNADDEIRMALRMAGIVCTDFCCWLLVVVLSILVQSKMITLDPVVYAWIVTFIMPINSCINPFLYTLTTVISDRLQGKENSRSSRIDMRKLQTESFILKSQVDSSKVIS